MAQHTPGPWKAGRPDMGTIVDGVESKWIYAGSQYVALASGRIEGDWPEIMANARLIAAAPTLLEALEDLALFHESGGHQLDADTVIAAANAAIALAKGAA